MGLYGRPLLALAGFLVFSLAITESFEIVSLLCYPTDSTHFSFSLFIYLSNQ